MVDREVAIALGGGAAKGLAHIGVLKGLEEDGVAIRAVAGTSMGSIIGALAAQGLSGREMESLFVAIDWVRLGRIMVTSVSGAAYHDMLRESLGGVRIEELERPFAAVSCDLDTGEMVVRTTGDLAEAVAASSSIPGILPPWRDGERRLVDGAVVEPVPVTAAAALGGWPVLAVNVVRPPDGTEPAYSLISTMPIRVELPSAFGRIERWLSRQRPETGDREIRARLSRWEVVLRSFHIMQYRLATCSGHEVPVIEPAVGRFGWFDFHRVDEIIAAGYDAYRQWAKDR